MRFARLLLVALLAIAARAPCGAQAAAVFNDFSPTVKGMTVGTSHCYLWAHVAPPWDMEVACYTAGVLRQIQVQPIGQSMSGTFAFCDSGSFVVPCAAGGTITWLVTPNGATSLWQLTAQPNGGLAIYQEGTFQ